MRWECWTASLYVEVHINSSKQKTGTVKTLGMDPYPLPSCHAAFVVSEIRVSYSKDALAFYAVEWRELQSDAGKTCATYWWIVGCCGSWTVMSPQY